MILDTLDNLHLYCAAGSRLEAAMNYLRHGFKPGTPDGRVDVLGDDVFALIQGYDTRAIADCRFEAHRKYLDIQYVYDGAEGMGWAPVETLEVADPFDTTRDVAFYSAPDVYTTAEVRSGMLTVFYPGDAHMPGIRLTGFQNVKKVVMKVSVL